MSIARLAQRLKTADFDRSVLQLSAQIPGTPFAIRHEPKEERLPGMRRWVDRRVIEEAMDAQSRGASEDAFANQAANSDRLIPTLAGGALGGAAGRYLANKYPDNFMVRTLAEKTPSAPLTGAILGSLLGGAAGYGYHHLTADKRRRDAREAYQGALADAQRNPRPPSALPQQRQDEGSASALPPRLLHTAPSLA